MTKRVSMLLATALGGVLLLAIPAMADPPAAADSMAAPAHPHKTLKFLTADQVDPAKLLPAPPVDGSDQQKAELAEVQRLYRTRTPERYARAQWDDGNETPALFATTLGDGFDLTKLPATAKLLDVVDQEQSVAAGMAKRYFKRNRPWGADPTIKPCDYKPGANPLTSYPSGHATLSYSVGYVLAQLMPEKAAAIQARAADFAYSREICGDHYPTDTEASHVLGVTVAIDLLADPRITPMVEAARAELRAAHLTGS